MEFDPGALLSRSYQLPRGPRVRLRLAQLRDLPAITALLVAEGHEPDAFQLARVLRSDPRGRLVICATALIGSTETVVGVGEIELSGPAAEPAFVVVDSKLTDGLGPLLRQALVGRASAIARGRAA
jgi:hypothetical protein